MDRVWRSVVLGGLLALLGSVSLAQSVGSRSHAGRFASGPGLGTGPGPQSFQPAITSLGIVAGSYRTANLPFQPHALGGPNPFVELRRGPLGPPLPPGQEGPGGLMLPHAIPHNAWGPRITTPPRVNNPARAEELVALGDRSFRGGDNHRAEERYKLAARANLETPIPHLHLAQIALIRGDYTTAAGYLRDAVASTRGSDWLLETPDIMAMYGEPGDFAKQLARLESWLQTHPDDRNGWFVLGAEHYLSGHQQAASDAFLRITDHQTDEALAVFATAAAIGLERSKLDFSAAVR